MEKFIKEIQDATGLDLEKGEFGFIAGRMMPTTEPFQGMQSAENMPGFQVWKRKDGVSKTKNISPKDAEDSKKQIIDFLIS